MDGNLGGREYDDMDEYDEDEWRHERMERMIPPPRMTYHHNYHQVIHRPQMSTMRIAMPSGGGVRKTPFILRKMPPMQSRPHPQHHIVRQMIQPVRMAKMNSRIDHPHSRIEERSSSREVPYLVPYANEETVRTSEDQHEEEEEEVERVMQDHSIKRLEDDLEVDVDGGSEGPSTSMPKMILRAKTPVFHPAENKALIENHQLKAKMANLVDMNCKFRDDITQLREEKRELLKQLRKQEKVIEKQSVDLAASETSLAELRRRDKEKDKKHERELALRDKRRKAITVMPCLPNRKVLFSKATKQAQSLRLRLLHRYLSELCGPVDGEHRLEEKNLIVLRWRKAHAPKPSLEIGRQLLPAEEEDFCHRFGIVGERKKEMKAWLGKKHIDLFGPSERALAVRKWRMGQREKRRKGQKEDKMVDVDEDVMDEVGNDTDDDELMDDIESVLEEECGGGEKSVDESIQCTLIIDDDEEREEEEEEDDEAAILDEEEERAN